MRKFFLGTSGTFCQRDFQFLFTSVLGKRYWILPIIFASVLGCLEGPTGPQGPAGADGTDGKDFSAEILYTVGTIYTASYRAMNPQFISILLPGATVNCIPLFVGIENVNGVYQSYDYTSIIADEGYRALIYDPEQGLIGKNYKVAYLP